MVSPLSDSTVGDRFKRMHWWWLWLLTFALVPLLGRARSESAVAEDKIAPLPVQTQVLEQVNGYDVTRTYTGEITARRSSDLGFEQAGTLVEILVDEGDTVPQGAPLARLDIRNLQAQRQQIEAQHRQAQARLQELQRGPRQEDIAAAAAAVQDLQAQLDLAHLQQQRREALYSQGAISREERDEKTFSAKALASRLTQAQSQLEELQSGTRVEQINAQNAQVAQIDANLRNLDISMSKRVIYAPFSGRISLRLVDEGVVVSPGQPLMRLVEANALEARIGIPNQITHRITSGSIQTIEVNGQSFRSQVTALLPEVEGTSQTVTVVLTLPPGAQPVIGTTARLKLQEQQSEPGYWLPTTALVAGEHGLWSTYVLNPPTNPTDTVHEVARRDVEVLYTESDRAFVRGLLQPEEEIITSGTHRLVPGQLVQN